MSQNFIASMNGESIREGDLMYSTWHDRPFFAKGVYIDSLDNEVYLLTPSGMASLKSCAKYKKSSPVYSNAVTKAMMWEKENF